MNTPDQTELWSGGGVITGGATGIGFAIAEALVGKGMNVLIADADPIASAKAVSRLEGLAGTADWIGADVRDPDAARSVVKRCVEVFGSIDVLVNNAGIYPVVPTLEMDDKTLGAIYEINLRAVVLFSREAARRMVELDNGGRIINIASVEAIHPSVPGLAVYAASKAGVAAFTRGLALELQPYRIAVYAIAPGDIATEGTERYLAELDPADAEEIRARMGAPQDIAAVALFLASPYARHISGATIVADGAA